MANSADSQEPKDGVLELRESTGEDKKCPYGHPGTTWRVLFEWDAEEHKWYILTQWFKCPVCSRRAIAEDRHVWPATVDEAEAAYEAKPSKEAKSKPLVLDRRD